MVDTQHTTSKEPHHGFLPASEWKVITLGAFEPVGGASAASTVALSQMHPSWDRTKRHSSQNS
jgi:hypothetical protein